MAIVQLLRDVLARKRERDYLDGILSGPDSAFRSELVEVMSRAGWNELPARHE
jgi:hypothetical protein